MALRGAPAIAVFIFHTFERYADFSPSTYSSRIETTIVLPSGRRLMSWMYSFCGAEVTRFTAETFGEFSPTSVSENIGVVLIVTPFCEGTSSSKRRPEPSRSMFSTRSFGESALTLREDFSQPFFLTSTVDPP